MIQGSRSHIYIELLKKLPVALSQKNDDIMNQSQGGGGGGSSK